uniref:Uncharacterized protein n=1 Tax=Aegilops tauschii subsp. strangulata TaxID=200361 RepID=A0A453GHM4_AEGTS
MNNVHMDSGNNGCNRQYFYLVLMVLNTRLHHLPYQPRSKTGLSHLDSLLASVLCFVSRLYRLSRIIVHPVEGSK